MNVPRSVCIVMLTAIGDAVHVLPVVNAMRRHWPDTRISWVLQPGPAALVRGHPAVDEVIVFERSRGLDGFRGVRRELAGRRFDVVLLLQPYLKAGVIAGMARAPLKIGIDRARARDLTWIFTNRRLKPRPRAHIQDEFLEFLDELGIGGDAPEWRLEPTVEERARYAGILPEHAGPTVAFVVGTSKPAKEWPADRYAALADLLAARGIRTVLVGGRSEREVAAARAIAAAAAHPPLDLLEFDLRKLVYLLDRVDVVVSPDTGPLHISVALGTPTVALMGYTNPRRYGPYRRFHDLLIDAFGDPGEDYPLDAPHRPGRMERITAAEVAERVELALRRYPRSGARKP